MVDIKLFVEKMLGIARNIGSTKEIIIPMAFFLRPDGNADIVAIDTNFMLDGRTKNALTAQLNKHMNDIDALCCVLIADSWHAAINENQRRSDLPKSLADYSGRAEVLIATAWGKGMPQTGCIQRYSRDKDNKRVWGEIEWSDGLASRFAGDQIQGLNDVDDVRRFFEGRTKRKPS